MKGNLKMRKLIKVGIVIMLAPFLTSFLVLDILAEKHVSPAPTETHRYAADPVINFPGNRASSTSFGGNHSYVIETPSGTVGCWNPDYRRYTAGVWELQGGLPYGWWDWVWMGHGIGDNYGWPLPVHSFDDWTLNVDGVPITPWYVRHSWRIDPLLTTGTTLVVDFVWEYREHPSVAPIETFYTLTSAKYEITFEQDGSVYLESRKYLGPARKQELRWSRPGGDPTYEAWSPVVGTTSPEPAFAQEGHNTGYITSSVAAMLGYGSKIDDWLEAQKITGAVTGEKLERNESGTLSAYEYKATCDISGASGLVNAQGDIIGYGSGTLVWTITDYEGDITIFTQPIVVVNNNYNYKVTADEGGSATPTAEGSVTSGTEIAIKATPNEGYEFDKWVVVDNKEPASFESADTVADNKFTMPASEVHIKATFKKIDYTVKASGEEGKGSGTANKAKANMDEVVTLTATPEPGFMFVGWVVKNGTITDAEFDPTDPDASFKMPAGNVEVQATFAPIVTSITIKKEVVGTKGDATDVFNISLSESNTLLTSVVLKEGESSSALRLGMGGASSKTIDVSELIPMDYDSDFTLSVIDNKDSSETPITGKAITVSLGDDITIVVKNTFAPTGFFKAKDFVRNLFKS